MPGMGTRDREILQEVMDRHTHEAIDRIFAKHRKLLEPPSAWVAIIVCAILSFAAFTLLIFAISGAIWLALSEFTFH